MSSDSAEHVERRDLLMPHQEAFREYENAVMNVFNAFAYAIDIRS